MPLRHYGQDVTSVFALMGDSENAITVSIAWALSQCPTFLNAILREVGYVGAVDDVQVTTQSFASDKGLTDVEIYRAGRFHAIVEAKRGWRFPDEKQFCRYLPRFRETQAPRGRRFLVSMSEASELYAKLYLARAIRNVPLVHISWRRALRLVTDSYGKSSSVVEKRWLDQLLLFLREVATMQNRSSNDVYVVSLSEQQIEPKSGHTWIDVVEKDNRYFHPIGTSGWPAEPPNYIAFRYRGRLQTVHHVANYEVVRNLKDRNRHWPKTDGPHFVYKLSKAMRPPAEMRTGKIYRGGRVWCLIDTLLSGEFKTISAARDASRCRLDQKS